MAEFHGFSFSRTTKVYLPISKVDSLLLKLTKMCYLGTKIGVLLSFLRTQIHYFVKTSGCYGDGWQPCKACEFCKLGKEHFAMGIPPALPCVVQVPLFLS